MTDTNKPYDKTSQVVPSCYHLDEKWYAGRVTIGNDNYQTYWYETKEEALEKLKQLEEVTKFHEVETIVDEGFFPERAQAIEELYQKSGRTNSLYTGIFAVN